MPIKSNITDRRSRREKFKKEIPLLSGGFAKPDNQSKIQYLTICPQCNEEESDEITVPDELKPIGQKAPDYKGTDQVTLDDCKDVVDVRPLRVRDEIQISTRTPEQRNAISNHIAHIIAPVVAVNGTQPDRLEELLEWYQALSPHDAKQLEDFIDNNSPHFSQDIPHKCDNCGNLWNFRLTLDQEFFRSGRVGTSRREMAANL